MTATENRAPTAGPSRTGLVSLDAAATTRCRRRVHLDHDPAAATSPRALPDPALEQRRGGGGGGPPPPRPARGPTTKQKINK
ncbi:MAG: hypothetical protein LH603_19440 [Pseudonocardia sp.]|nr:hypothetical protein [Pseudonocardia sp.]